MIVHPGDGVKEQTAGLYAKKRAPEGESGGEPHFLEDPVARVSDVWSVVDYLEQLEYVDTTKIGILSICAGGGYAVAAAKAD
ncbi:uncharacterized protein YcjY [Aspergillus udagawae]|uniref:Uncharacterized protein YcjY n=1 Tax=Aspergillus udagawae TaxID=91492 RepID=A0A8H3RQL3_9EURO|nr:uncharacterized protein Aud_001270 [Aspergillus udagawae]GFF23502.1 uncharacterized protein YcjY [Aspergillus udagawae]GFF36004.1 uncharacterized protein YcjY [Aspergillus udagawae]GFF36113.1 uncharacterized protein YcjY [Aspergillus udagawae]GFF82067.1 uncharacterized protein YcjY [Aspergillus udagawae]GFG07205.1 uncharacterized protein YcjY [Aspergillus udagawae]